MSIFSIIMGILFWIVLIFTIILHKSSKGKYDEYLAPLSKKQYKALDYFPIGFYLLDKLNYKFSTKYDFNLLMKFAEISGHKYASYYLKVHYANKIVLLLLAFLFLPLWGMLIGADTIFLLIAIALPVLIFILPDKEIKEKAEKRKLSIRIDFPDFLNKLILLVNTGMTISRAWEKTVEGSKKTTPLYNELTITVADIKAGKPEHVAYEDFAKRCRIAEITKFVSFVVQNLRKGSDDIVSQLRLLSGECWESRKTAAKRLGEEAATKLLLPMMIMFVAILIIVAMPAVLALNW